MTRASKAVFAALAALLACSSISAAQASDIVPLAAADAVAAVAEAAMDVQAGQEIAVPRKLGQKSGNWWEFNSPPPCYKSPPPPCYQYSPPPPCYKSPPPPCNTYSPPPPCYKSPPPPCYQYSPPPPCYKSPPPPCYKSPPPPCNTYSPPPPSYTTFPYQQCYSDCSGVYQIQLKDTSYLNHDYTRYCFWVQAKFPDAHKKCGSFDLWAINFKADPECVGWVSDLKVNGQSVSAVSVPNLPQGKAMLQITRGGNQVLDSQYGIASHGAKVCFTLPNFCPLNKFCRGDECKTAFFPNPYSGLNCCPNWSFGSQPHH